MPDLPLCVNRIFVYEVTQSGHFTHLLFDDNKLRIEKLLDIKPTHIIPKLNEAFNEDYLVDFVPGYYWIDILSGKGAVFSNETKTFEDFKESMNLHGLPIE